MGKLNDIQLKISKALGNQLSDVRFDFTAKGERGDSNGSWDPDNPSLPATTYSGTGAFGLGFTQKDTDIFQIQENDQKAIVLMCDTDGVPMIGDVVSWRDGDYSVIDLNVIPADNGWVLQLRSFT